ncbi:MAG: tetratricopeptide repeat protein [Candidatus Hodarchaeales archaeon]
MILVITNIKKLIEKGDLDTALEMIHELPPEDKLYGMILESWILEMKGQYMDALHLVDQAVKGSFEQGNVILQLRALIRKGYVLGDRLTKLDELSNTIQDTEKLLKRQEKDDERKKGKIVMDIRGSLDYLKGVLDFEKGETESALDYLQKSLSSLETTGNDLGLASTLVMIGWVHIHQTGKLDLAFENIQKSLVIRKKLENKHEIAQSLNVLGVYYTRKGNNDLALDYYEKSLAFYEEIGNEQRMANLYNNISTMYRDKEEYNRALDYLEEFLNIKEKISDKDAIAIAHVNIAVILAFKGQLDTSLEHLEIALALREEMDQNMYIAFLSRTIGSTYAFKGDYRLAIENSQKSLAICEEIGNELHIAYSLDNLSLIHTLSGEPELALDYSQRSLKIYQDSDDKTQIPGNLVYTGINYRTLGNLDSSRKYLEEGLDSFRKTRSGGVFSTWYSFTLLYLVLVMLDLDDQKAAQEYLEQLHEINQKSSSKFSDLRTRFAEAMVLKASKRGLKKLQAQQLFKRIVDGEIIEHHLTVLAILNLCELNILEMKISDDPDEFLQETIKLSEMLHETGEKQKSVRTIIMARLIQAKLALVEFRFEDAFKLLENVRTLAEFHNYQDLLNKIIEEHELLNSELHKWVDLSQKNVTIKERVDQARFNEYIAQAIKTMERMASSGMHMQQS